MRITPCGGSWPPVGMTSPSIASGVAHCLCCCWFCACCCLSDGGLCLFKVIVAGLANSQSACISTVFACGSCLCSWHAYDCPGDSASFHTMKRHRRQRHQAPHQYETALHADMICSCHTCQGSRVTLQIGEGTGGAGRVPQGSGPVHHPRLQ